MNFRIVKSDSGAIKVSCVACGKKVATNQEPVYADIDGDPFVDYYCYQCASIKQIQGVS